MDAQGNIGSAIGEEQGVGRRPGSGHGQVTDGHGVGEGAGCSGIDKDRLAAFIGDECGLRSIWRHAEGPISPVLQEPSPLSVQLFVCAITEFENAKVVRTATERLFRIRRIDFRGFIDVPCTATNHCIGRRYRLEGSSLIGHALEDSKPKPELPWEQVGKHRVTCC